ncbi:hypothetical protein K402DRAFT_416819 [Aulographum hederae CBS 113979]|uniref:S-adenosyl-L-methionine-dependent methyltransferase n=1 Tax=Aulographum hederae CBS 113979 TaxID=1176131 RepID=A0A6G1HEL6_9PEZI|nr:hypothetical protein K402DRAFT_416819 [Aulographum hederae CBS 113979]
MAIPNQPIGETIQGLLKPGGLIVFAIYYWFITLLTTIFVDMNPSILYRDFMAFRHKAFSRLWLAMGEAMSLEMPGDTITLLKSTSGTVLDCGPGSGQMTKHLDPNLITAIYGAEPAVGLHPELVKNAKDAGFGAKYVAMECGIEPGTLIPTLAKQGLLSSKDGSSGQGAFDTILCIRVLCGVPHPAETVQTLYRLLKPGGRLIFSEHVVNPWRTEGTMIGRAIQAAFMTIGWSFWLGGCSLDRHTLEMLEKSAEEEDGGWAKKEVKRYDSWCTVPFVVGTLTKKG